MATVSHPASETPERRLRLPVPEMWPSLAIAVMWLVVLLAALFGPDFVSSNAGSYTRIPSAVFVAFFAWLATWVVARHGFDRRRRDAD
jgi:hypothetical protein